MEHHDVFLSRRTQPTDDGEWWHGDSVGCLTTSTHVAHFYFPVSRFCTHELATNRASVLDPSVLLSPTGTASPCTGFNHIRHGIESRTVCPHIENAYPSNQTRPLRKGITNTSRALHMPLFDLGNLRNCWREESSRNRHAWSSK